jgi:hypothetical protein
MDLFYRMTEKSLKSDNFKSGTEFCNSNKNFKKYDFFNNFFFLKTKKSSFVNIKKFKKLKLNNFINLSVTDSVKFFSALSKKYFTIFFLRKQKFFNKGRYSRNRQLYRTGVY